MIFFTSDTHFGHKNIIRYCDRPFKDTDHMDEEIIRRWNEVVGPDDTVYHLGDIAMGDISKSLPKVGRLNGHKIGVVGNHDRLFHTYNKNHRDRFWPEYCEVFEKIASEEGTIIPTASGLVRLSHFPYTGDHTPEDRHSDVRPVDDGMLLIHGHTHAKERLTYSTRGTPQIHVGQDAWDFYPVPFDTIVDLLSGA